MSFDRWKYWFDEPKGEVWDALHRPDKMKEFLITASVVPEIMGVGYSSAAKQYKLYTKQQTYQPPNTPAVDWGQTHEEEALNTFLTHYPQWVGIKPGILFHKDYPTVPLAASLDMILVQKTDDISEAELINLECKCPFYRDKQLPYSMDSIPLKAIIQTQVQMMVTGIQKSILWYWNPKDCVGIDIVKDDYSEKLILSAIKDFKEYVDGKKPWKNGEMKKKYAQKAEICRKSVIGMFKPK
jgi:hypothetical protein